LALKYKQESSYVNSLSILGVIYEKLEQAEDAIMFHEKAKDIHDSMGDKVNLSTDLLNLGAAYNLAGKYLKAEETWMKAIQLKREINDHAGLARCLSNLGALQIQIRNTKSAITNLKEAIEICKQTESTMDEANAQFNLAQSYFLVNQFDKSKKCLQRAYEVYLKLGNILGLARCEHKLANLFARKKQYIEAGKFYSSAINLFEEIMLDLKSDRDRTKILSQIESVYWDAFKMHQRNENLAQCIAISQRFKSRSTIDLFLNKIEYFHGVKKDMNLIQEEIRLRNQIEKLKEKIVSYVGHESQDESIKKDKSTLVSLKNKHKTCFTKLQRSSEKFLSILRPDPLKVERFRNSLDGMDYAVLDYFWIDKDRVSLLYFDSCSIKHYDINVTKHAQKDLMKLVEDICQGYIPQIQPSLDIFIPSELTTLLSKKKLAIICPHWYLHFIPFISLPLDNPLINHIPIIYSPNLSFFVHSVYKDIALNRIVAYGDPKKNLPGSLIEIEQLETLFPGKVDLRKREECSIAQFMKDIKDDNYKIFHFAAHGSLDVENPALSGIQLNDSILSSIEILNIDTNVDLFVLSACKVGAGVPSSGDDLIGLPRALLIAGVKRIISAMWPIEDQYTKTLMYKFYNELKKSLNCAEALRTAQLSMLNAKGNASAGYWSAFKLYGYW
jgi:tetratricopeptide (TPR) repeat protein